MSSIFIQIAPAVFGASLAIALARYHKVLSPEAKAQAFVFYKRKSWGVLGVVGPMLLSICLSRVDRTDLISFIWLAALFVMIWPGMFGWLMGRGPKMSAVGEAPTDAAQQSSPGTDFKPPTAD